MLLTLQQMEAIGKYNAGAEMTEEERKTALNAEDYAYALYGKHVLLERMTLKEREQLRSRLRNPEKML